MKNEILFQKFMIAISEIFGEKITKLTMDIYWQTLKDYSDDQCAKAFEHVIKYSKYFPKPADIIEAIELTLAHKTISPTEARMQIENWLYNGGPEPQDPAIKRIIQSYGGWERLGMTSYQDLKYLLSDIEARFEAIAQWNRGHSRLLEENIPTHTATALSCDDLSPLRDAVGEGLDSLAPRSHHPIAQEKARQWKN